MQQFIYYYKQLYMFRASNNRTAPAYKTAKKLNTILSNHLHLENQYNVSNSNTLAKDLIQLKINNKRRLLTLDIKDLCQYPNKRNQQHYQNTTPDTQWQTHRQPNHHATRNRLGTKLFHFP